MKKIAQLRTLDQFMAHLESLGLDLPVDAELDPAVLAQPIPGTPIGNRFCVLPMEGWDGTTDGRPSELTTRRWTRFGLSGAKLIWGGEAVAVRPDGRANPHQLMILDSTVDDLAALRAKLVAEHAAHFDTTADLLVGLQLTHSGRYARPHNAKLEPRTAYRHPLLDRRTGISDDSRLMTDDDLDALVADFIAAAVRAQQAGFAFVDIKHCHGYLGHELLTAHDRPGRYGGSFENRTRFLRGITEGIRHSAPGLGIGVRLSAFDWIAFRPGEERVGAPEGYDGAYRYAFGGDGTGTGIDLSEPDRFLDLLEQLGIKLVCLTAGSPYYNPHIQRPAMFPPSDGYLPPEDPLAGVARQIGVTAALKAAHPGLVVVGSGYSYLQDWLPNVAQAVIRRGKADSIGLGRMMLSYPQFPADVLAGRPLQRKIVCRTFSDCTTAPRNHLVSGCYPLDPLYKARPEAEQLAAFKAESKS